MSSQRDQAEKQKAVHLIHQLQLFLCLHRGGGGEDVRLTYKPQHLLGFKNLLFYSKLRRINKKVTHAGRFLFSSDLVPASVPNRPFNQTYIRNPCNIYSIYRVNPRYCVPLTVLVTLNSTDEVVAVAMLFSPAASGSSHPVR